MSDHLNAEKSRVISLEAEVQTLQDIRDSLQEQIRLLEERVATEETRCKQAQVCIQVTKIIKLSRSFLLRQEITLKIF